VTAELSPEPLPAVASRPAEQPTPEAMLDELRRLRILAEVADTVTQELSLDRQLPRLIDLILEALHAERATLFLHDRDAGELFSRVLSGDGITEIRLPADAGIAGAVFCAGDAQIIADAYQDARFNP
jgi:adenylate cyclase